MEEGLPTLRTQLLWILGIAVVLAVYMTMPVSRCPRACGAHLDQILGYTRLPGVTRQEAEKMLAWGRSSYRCRFCRSTGYVTLLRFTQEIYDTLR